LRAATVVAWRFLARKLRMRGDLHFEVRRGDLEPAVGMFEQNIRKDRQRMPPFDNARDCLQRFQKRVAWDLF
jgi:hypothetical protein